MMGICIYWLSRHVILQIKNHTQLTRTVGNISQSDLYMLADLLLDQWVIFQILAHYFREHIAYLPGF